jgi:hypothetical protein
MKTPLLLALQNYYQNPTLQNRITVLDAAFRDDIILEHAHQGSENTFIGRTAGSNQLVTVSNARIKTGRHVLISLELPPR